MVGKGILLECLNHDEIEEVLVIGRSSIGMTHAKLNEMIHQDFSDFSQVSNKLSGYDACFYRIDQKGSSFKGPNRCGGFFVQ